MEARGFFRKPLNELVRVVDSKEEVIKLVDRFYALGPDIKKNSNHIDIAATIRNRATDQTPGSYTVTLLNRGIATVAQKVGEEAVEVVVAATAQIGCQLVSHLAAQAPGQTIYWDIFDENTAAVELAKALGFTPQRPFLRMFRGQDTCPGDPRRQFAIGDPATG